MSTHGAWTQGSIPTAPETRSHHKANGGKRLYRTCLQTARGLHVP